MYEVVEPGNIVALDHTAGGIFQTYVGIALVWLHECLRTLSTLVATINCPNVLVLRSSPKVEQISLDRRVLQQKAGLSAGQACNLLRHVMSLGRLRRQWEAHGRRNALAAILTPSVDQPEWDEAGFLETGRHHVAHLMDEADRLVPHRRRGRALDFGCGIGRLTVALADYYDEVVGVDIADSMVEQARHRNPAPDRIRYEHNTNPDLLRFPTGRFDLVCSWIVLQHMPPPLIRAYVTELVRVVGTGGLLVFQLPVDTVSAEVRERFVAAPVRGGTLKSRIPSWLVRPYRSLKYIWFRRTSSYMAMYGLARDDVTALVERSGGRLLEVRSDQSHGTPCPGFSYWVTR